MRDLDASANSMQQQRILNLSLSERKPKAIPGAFGLNKTVGSGNKMLDQMGFEDGVRGGAARFSHITEEAQS